MTQFTFVPLSQAEQDPDWCSSRSLPPTPQHQVSLQPAELYFGSIAVGAQSTVQQAVLTNTGTRPAPINAVTGVGDYQVSHNCPAMLQPGASCEISAVFAPNAVGSSTGGVYVDAGESSRTPAFLQLVGAGESTSEPTTGLSVTSLGFGTVPVGQVSAEMAVTITNLGSSELTISAISHTGPFNIVLPELPATLTAGQSLVLEVAFAPTQAGAATGSITVTSNGAGVTDVTMTGIGQ